MSDDPMKQAGDAMKAGAQTVTNAGAQAAEMGRSMVQKGMEGMGTAASTATDMGRSMMEKGMASMAEFHKMFADLKMPGMGGMDMVMQAQRRNMEVLSAANRVALEGAQAVARRHMEIMQQTVSEMTDAMRDLTSPESPQARAAKQAEMLKVAYERAVAHMRELADLIQKANTEALSMLNSRFTEAMEEVKQLAAQAGQPGGHSSGA